MLHLGYAAEQAREAVVVAARLRGAGLAVALDLEPSAPQPGEPLGDGRARLDGGGVRWRLRGREGGGLDALLAAFAEDAG